MSFDRAVALIALLIALSGGVPTYLAIQSQRAFFGLYKIEIGDPALYGVGFGLPVKVYLRNTGDKDDVVLRIAVLGKDDKGQVVLDKMILPITTEQGYPGNQLPLRLGPLESMEIAFEVFYRIPGNQRAEFLPELSADGYLDHPPDHWRYKGKYEIAAGEIASNRLFDYLLPNTISRYYSYGNSCGEARADIQTVYRCFEVTVHRSRNRTAKVGEMKLEIGGFDRVEAGR